MDKITLAKKLRFVIEQLAQEHLDDDAALDATQLFPVWKSGVEYTAEQRVRYNDVLYRCLQAHTAQLDWSPDVSPSLFAKVLIPDASVISEWEQPESTNPYMQGDKVTHNGKTWESLVDNNVWEPGVYGWTEVE